MEDFNLAPKSVYRGRNSDGTEFRVNEYDFGTVANIDFSKLFLGLLGFGAIAPFMSVILFIMAVWNFRGRFQTEYLMCIILSSYFLFDAYKGWMVLCLASIAFDEHQLNWLLGINTGIIFASIFLWAFGDMMAEIISRIDSLIARWLVMILIVVIAMTFSCHELNKITAKNPDWVNKNLEIGDYVPEGSARMILHDKK